MRNVLSLRRMICLALFPALIAANAEAALTAAELAQLGVSLTPFGAEKAGNRDGSIPAYSGGLPVSTNPAGFKKNSGQWTNPYQGEKPLYAVTAENMDSYGDRLSETSKALLRRQPGYRMDVYPSHRSVAFPDWVLENARRNAQSAQLSKGGLALEGAYGGVPFPVPKNGYEVMWNHLTRYSGHAQLVTFRNWYADSQGTVVNSGEFHAHYQAAYNNPNSNGAELRKNGNVLVQAAWDYTGPAYAVGNATLYIDTLDPVEQPRRAWAYAAAGRRIRLAPDVSYDTPIASQGGVSNYDDNFLFEGAMDMFEFKLLGKREMLIPYNGYDVTFGVEARQLLKPGHLNPDHVRWELHRVWLVEAKLKPGRRHSAARRLFYLDEDWSGAGMSDAYDAAGQLVRGLFLTSVQLYDQQTPAARTFWGYNLKSGYYVLACHLGDRGMGLKLLPEGLPALTFSPDALPSRSVRR